MEKITVDLKHYDVIVGENILNKTGKYCREINRGNNAFIITDSNVGSLYSSPVIKSLKASRYTISTYVFEAGEQSKNLTTLEKIYNQMAHKQINRSDIIIALGGGVVGDIAGFAAATWMRGIDFVQVPTTLLSMVDASVGGKTAIDLMSGKNLVGAFWQPSCVIADTLTLQTLDKNQISNGYAEIIKAAAIYDNDFFESLENNDDAIAVISRSIKIKRDIVQKDEKEKNIRMLLNFGHTIGHAIEQYYSYTMSHGNAVAIGMSVITHASEKMGLTEKGTWKKLIKLLKKYNLPTEYDIDKDEIYNTIMLDKKRIGKSINIVLISKIGQGFIKQIDIESIKNFL